MIENRDSVLSYIEKDEIDGTLIKKKEQRSICTSHVIYFS